MSYTRVWSESVPTDSDAASTIDDLLRNLKVDIRERMNNILRNEWETGGDDPKLLDIPIERAVVRLSADESIVTATTTAIPWDTEVVDVGDLVDLAAQTTRITIVTTGFYLIVGNVNWAAGTTGVRQAYIRLNGSSTIAVQGGHAGSTPAPATHVTYLGVLAAADYIELEVRHGQGSNLNVLNDTVTHLSVMRYA